MKTRVNVYNCFIKELKKKRKIHDIFLRFLECFKEFIKTKCETCQPAAKLLAVFYLLMNAKNGPS